MHWVSKEERRKEGLGDQSQGLPKEWMLGGTLDGRMGGRSRTRTRIIGNQGSINIMMERSRRCVGPDCGSGG